MKNPRAKGYKQNILKILKEQPKAGLVKNRHKFSALILSKEYPNLMKSVSPDTMLQFLQDHDYIERRIRDYTQGKEQELKDKLQVETQRDLGYGV